MEKENLALVFDIGGLLTHSNKEQARIDLAKKYNIDENLLLKEILLRHKLFVTGKINYENYMSEITNVFNIKDFQKFSKDWEELLEKGFKLNNELLDLIKILSNTYKIYSLSNVNPLFEKIRIKKGVYNHILEKFSSCDNGLKKPDKDFFELFLKKTNLLPINCFFIDDSEKNILAAKELGMNTLLFKSNEELINDFKKLGIFKK